MPDVKATGRSKTMSIDAADPGSKGNLACDVPNRALSANMLVENDLCDSLAGNGLLSSQMTSPCNEPANSSGIGPHRPFD
jgi:hypothetical protein